MAGDKTHRTAILRRTTGKRVHRSIAQRALALSTTRHAAEPHPLPSSMSPNRPSAQCHPSCLVPGSPSRAAHRETALMENGSISSGPPASAPARHKEDGGGDVVLATHFLTHPPYL